MADRDSEAEHDATETQPASPRAVAAAEVTTVPQPAARSSELELGTTLGRFRIDRIVGEGGMGFVYAAFDPDLERRIALKVLRTERDGDQGRARLLREARAMARVTHPNVVTVHEVGSIGRRDYIAMELVEGESLDAWLATLPPVREVVAAFVAAGRGLATAHAAGLIHRDFKPANVLRTRTGRILVTDFGIARSSDDESLPGKPSTISFATVTVTGQVIGTPAYMAPEQWDAATIGPTADQFAFCVALWEAIAGKRPYRGSNAAELRDAIARGPRELDTQNIPRHLRAILQRGLEPDPADRWPSMDALLAKLERDRKAPLLAGVAATVIAGTAIAIVASRGDGDAACPLPHHDPDAIAAEIAGAPAAPRITATLASWHAVRGMACAGDVDRNAVLDCLDGVLERVVAVSRSSLARGGPLSGDDVARQLVDPIACVAGSPRLAIRATADTTRILALHAGNLQQRDDKRADAALDLAAQTTEPCAKALAQVAALAVTGNAREVPVARDAEIAVDRCGDDHLRAQFALTSLRRTLARPMLTGDVETALQRFDAAVDRLGQPDLIAQRSVAQAAWLGRRDKPDAAIPVLDTAIARFGELGREREQLDARILRAQLTLQHPTPAGLPAARDDLARVRARLVAAGDRETATEAAMFEALVRLLLGDVAGANRVLPATPTAVDLSGPARRGRVVDAAGRPIAGATVVGGPQLFATQLGPLPLDRSATIAITDRDGTFSLAGVHDGAIAIAFADTRRSQPVPLTDALELVIAPPRVLAGRVELHGMPRSRYLVTYQTGAPTTLYTLAPIAADGTFELVAPTVPGTVAILSGLGTDHLTTGAPLAIGAGTEPRTDLVVETTLPGRTVRVTVRSTLTTPLASAKVVILSGDHRTAQTFADNSSSQPLQLGMAKPIERAAKGRPGDLEVTFTNVTGVELSVCAMALPADLEQPDVSERFFAHLQELDIRCVLLDPLATEVLVETPPQRRID